jgi:hypothetical protein
MPALNFQKRFAEAVYSGDKRQTIRAPRKNPIWKGDTLFLYTGMRTKNCRRLCVAICTHVRDIRISKNQIQIEKMKLSPQQMDLLARDDGFSGFAEMREWFSQTHALPFRGQIYRWTLEAAS